MFEGKGEIVGALSMEQQFKLKVVEDQSKNLTLEQAQEYVVEISRQMMVKDNIVKDVLRRNA